MNTPETKSEEGAPGLIDDEDVKKIMEPTTLELMLQELEEEGEVTFPFAPSDKALEEQTHMDALNEAGKGFAQEMVKLKRQLKSIVAQLDVSRDTFWDIIKDEFTEDQEKVFIEGVSSSYDVEKKEVTIYKVEEQHRELDKLLGGLKGLVNVLPMMGKDKKEEEPS